MTITAKAALKKHLSLSFFLQPAKLNITTELIM